MKAILGIVTIILAAAGIMAGTYGMLLWGGFLAKTGVNIRTNIYEESQSYQRGMRAELAKLKREYDAGTAAERAAIASLIRAKYSGATVRQLSPDLQHFLNTIMGS